MPGFGLPCPPPDPSVLPDVIYANGCELAEVMSALVQPLNAFLMGNEQELKPIVRKLMGCVKKEVKSNRDAIAGIAADIGSVIASYIHGSQYNLDMVTSYIPAEAIGGVGLYPVPESGPAGWDGGTPTWTTPPPIYMPSKVSPVRPDLGVPTIGAPHVPFATGTAGAGFAEGVSVSSGDGGSTQPHGAIHTGQAGAGIGGEAIIARGQEGTSQPPQPKTTPETRPVTRPPAQPAPSESSPESPRPSKTEQVRSDAASGDATSLSSSAADTKASIPVPPSIDLPGPVELFDLADLNPFHVGILSAAKQSEIGTQPPASFEPVAFGD